MTMKNYLPLAFSLLLALASVSLAQETSRAAPSPAPSPKPAMSKAKIQKNLIAIEKKLWEAWKNKDPKPFKAALSADTVGISEGGVEGKAATLKAIAESSCVVKSYSLSDFKVTHFNSSTALLTYKSTQDITCGTTTVPPTVWSSSLYLLRGGKWYAASHQETPASAQP